MSARLFRFPIRPRQIRGTTIAPAARAEDLPVEPAAVETREEKIAAARRRFGGAFAHEPGSTWAPSPEPFLINWLRSRRKDPSS